MAKDYNKVGPTIIIYILLFLLKSSWKVGPTIIIYILINDKWMKIGENIDDLQLIDINKNFVILENDNQKLKLELVNEEYLKNIY